MLYNYVKDNIRRGVSIDAIRQALKQSGYKDQDIESAIDYVFRKKDPQQSVSENLLKKTESSISSFKSFFGDAGQRISRVQKPSSRTTQQQLYVSHVSSRPSEIKRSNDFKKYIPYAILGLLFVSLLIIMLLSRAKPPIVVFVDNKTGEYVSGDVYYNGSYIGATKGTFNKLPENFCKEKSSLILVTEKGSSASWDTDESDCKNRKLIFRINILPVQEVQFFVTLEFMTEENGESLSGDLIIDGYNKGAIDGSYEIYQGECRIIRTINLTGIKHPGIPLGYAEWFHDPLLCEHDIIHYKVPTYSMPTTPKQQPTTNETINKTAMTLKITKALQNATTRCEKYCPTTTNCSKAEKISFCSQFLENIDLNGNGKYGEFVKNVIGDFGVCEYRVYCSQITFCRCDEVLTFDSCISLLCTHYLNQSKSLQESTRLLQKQFQEGGCESDSSYESGSSWRTWYISHGMLNCTNS